MMINYILGAERVQNKYLWCIEICVQNKYINALHDYTLTNDTTLNALWYSFYIQKRVSNYLYYHS